MSRFFSNKFASLVPYTPGEQPKDRTFIKLNTNESPFPPSSKAVEAAAEAAKTLQLYPDPECRLLTEAVAAQLGVRPEEVLLTNGSDEILNFAFMAYCDKDHPAVFPDITYGFYPVFAKINTVPYEEIPLRDDFSIGIRDYLSLDKTIFIANPNAPTGLFLPPADIEKILKSNPDTVVVVDEAYIDFGGKSALELIEKYGDRHYLVLNNGTDLGKYNLPESTRAEIRQAEGIPVDAFVLGHIGRFIDAKNHVFLLKIFCEILKKNQNSRLLLVGDGELKSDIHVLARKYGIAEKVIFTGLRGDIPELLKAMDVFCLPSKTEGVPVTVVEAQAAGVKCVISDVVVDDVMLTNRIFKMSLEESESMWADKILYGKEHSNEKNMLINFDIHHVITQLSKYYEEILDGKI